MLIILEGADKQGKTSLAHELVRIMGAEYFHEGPPTAGAGGYARQLDRLARWSGNRKFVLDRSFIGEMVYGPLLRGKSCLSFMEFDVLCRMANSLGAVVVHCQQPIEVSNRWQMLERSAESGITGQINQVARDRFARLMDMVVASRLPTLRYEAHTPHQRERWLGTYDVVCKERHGRAEVHRQFWKDALNKVPFNGYGSNKPKVVLVGEQLNEKATWLGLPFDGGSASQYLSETLQLAGIYQEECYFMNARLHDGSPAAEMELLHLKAMSNPRFVGLGKVAQEFLYQHVPHDFKGIPHPQYWKRFRSQERDGYVKMLKEACR